MRKLKIFLLSLILIFSFSTGIRAEYFSDIIVTSTDGIWTDARSYATLNDAITAVGSNQRTIVIPSPQTVTTLTVPSNVTLRFERDGSIVNSGQLTKNTKSIISDDHKIFAGTGDIDFAAGTVLRLSWFHNLWNALTMTSDDYVTIEINKAINATASCSVGNFVTLKWNAPNIISANAGVTISNVGQIEAGNYQIIAGAGNFRFRDGTRLKLEWFPYLRTALTWISTTDVTLTVNTSSDVDYSDSVPSNIQIKVDKGGELVISPGITLTIANAKQIDIGPYYLDPFAGTGSVKITGGLTYTPATSLTGAVLFQLYLGFNALIQAYDYEIDALTAYGGGTSYTNATVTAACTAVGANYATIVLKSGTWTYSANVNHTATCPNATFKFANGAVISHGANTLGLPNLIAEPTQKIFTGSGTVTINKHVTRYPEWWGAKDDDGVTNNTLPFQYALNSGGDVEVAAPTGGYYKITDTLSQSVENTNFHSHTDAQIIQATSAKGGVNVTCNDCTVEGLHLVGPQYVTSVVGETAINAYGADSSHYISNFKAKRNKIYRWGEYGILMAFVSYFDVSDWNNITYVYQAGIQGLSVSYGNISHNYVDYIAEVDCYGISLSRVTTASLVTDPLSRDVIVDSNIVRNVAKWTAYDTHGGQRITFSNNQSYNCLNGIAIGSANQTGGGPYIYSPLDCTATGNELSGRGTGGIGIAFTGAPSSAPYTPATGSIIGNKMVNFGDSTYALGSMMYLHDTQGIPITGNSFSYCGSNCLLLYYSNFGFDATGNTFKDAWSNTPAVGTSTGINVNYTYNTGHIGENSFLHGSSTATYLNNVCIRIGNETGNYVSIDKNFRVGWDTYLYDSGQKSLTGSTAGWATSGVTETILATTTVLGDTLGIGGKMKIMASGIKTNGAGDKKSIYLYFGTGTSFEVIEDSTSADDWRVEATIMNTGIATQVISWVAYDGDVVTQGYETATTDTSGSFVVRMSAYVQDTHADVVTQYMWDMDIF